VIIPNDIKVKVEITELIGSSNEIKELKAKKQGELTPKEIFRVTLNELVNERVEEVVVISKNSDNKVSVSWSSEDAVEVFGMLGIANALVINEVNGDCDG